MSRMRIARFVAALSLSISLSSASLAHAQSTPPLYPDHCSQPVAEPTAPSLASKLTARFWSFVAAHLPQSRDRYTVWLASHQSSFGTAAFRGKR